MTEINPLLALKDLGQTVWVDYIDRNILRDGTVQELIDRDGISGVTTNPIIFEQAIAHSVVYDESIVKCSLNGLNAEETYESIALEDVRRAAEMLLPVYESSNGRTGYVSIEVSPLYAYDTQRTLMAAQRIWTRLAYPNVMIKVPATKEGIPAIRELTAGGINVNATLIFSVERYREVADAYMEGLEQRLVARGAIDTLMSVASFFVGRIDAKVDGLLDAVCVHRKEHEDEVEEARDLRGRIAVALASSARRAYTELYSEDRWIRLAERGGRRQRLLWASTDNQMPGDSDVKYVESLIVADTVTTLPLETLIAYRHHGEPSLRFDESASETTEIARRLKRLDIDMKYVALELEDDAIRRFVESHRRLIASLRERSRPMEQSACLDVERLAMSESF